MMTLDDCLRASAAAVQRRDAEEAHRMLDLAENLIHAAERVSAGLSVFEGAPIIIREKSE